MTGGLGNSQATRTKATIAHYRNAVARNRKGLSGKRQRRG